MLRFQKKNAFKSIAEINVTPLVDVSLVLVIIFMVTVPMLFKPMVDIMIPKALTGVEQDKQIIYVNITNDLKLYIDSDPVPDIQRLAETLRQLLMRSEQKVVVIRADERLAYSRITDVMAIAKKAGAKKLLFATEYKKREVH